MNREILFRGKRVDTGEWVYGFLSFRNEITVVTEDASVGYVGLDAFDIDPKTIGQFTGLTDMNGFKIFEGDILRYPPKERWDETNYSSFEVFFSENNADNYIGYSIHRTHHHGAVCGGYIPSFKPKTVSQMIVIGNIHDNPELLQNK